MEYLYLLAEKSERGSAFESEESADCRQIRRLYRCGAVDGFTSANIQFKQCQTSSPNPELNIERGQVVFWGSTGTITEADMSRGRAFVEVTLTPACTEEDPRVQLTSWGSNPVFIAHNDGDCCSDAAFKLSSGQTCEARAGDWLFGPYGFYDRVTFHFSYDEDLDLVEGPKTIDNTMIWMNRHLFLLPDQSDMLFQYQCLRQLSERQVFTKHAVCRHLLLLSAMACRAERHLVGPGNYHHFPEMNTDTREVQAEKRNDDVAWLGKCLIVMPGFGIVVPGIAKRERKRAKRSLHRELLEH